MKTTPLAVVASRKRMSSLSLLGALLGLALPLVGDLRADPVPTILTLSHTGTDLEGFQAFELQWNAISNATYKVQVSTNLEAGSWETVDLVTPAGGQATMPLTHSDQFVPEGISSGASFFRLILPQPQIFAVEPAIFPPGASVDAYVIGQCFETNDIIRVDGVPVAGMVHLNPNQFHGPLPTLSAGRHLVELVRDGVVKSSFTVTCADAATNPELVLQGPPVTPPASPHQKIAKSRSNIQNNRMDGGNDQSDSLQARDACNNKIKVGGEGRDMIIGGGGGYLDEDADNDGIPDMVEGVSSRVLPIRVIFSSLPTVLDMTTGGGGVSPFSGEVQLGEADLVIPGRGLDFIWARTYNSRIGRSTSPNGWTFSYDVSLAMQSDGSVLLRQGNGRVAAFYPTSTGGWSRPEYFVEIGDLDVDGFPDVVTFADSGKWVFNSLLGTTAPGMLSQIIDRNANTMKLHYDGGGQLIEVVDDLDRTNTVAYDTSGRIASVTDFSGRTARYEYDTNGDLVSVISPPVIGTPTGNDFPGGKTNRYTYSSGYLDDRENHLLLSVVDATGQTIYQHVYQHNQTDFDFLRCISVQHWTNTPTMLSYLPQTPTPANGFATLRCIVNDPVGNVTEYFYDARNRPVKMQELTGRATPGVAVTATVNRPTGKLRSSDPNVYETRWSWNNDSLCTQETLPGGEKLQCIYESDFDKSTRARKRADCRVVREIASEPVDSDGDFVPDATERVWRFDYDPRFGSPSNNRTRINELEAILKNIGILARSSGGNGGYGGTVVARAPNKAPNITHEYHRFVTSATDPRGIVTTVEYDAHGLATRIERRGDVAIIIDTTGGMGPGGFSLVYNPHGQPTAITNAADANGYRRVDTFSYYTNGPQAGYLQSCVVDAGGLALTESYEYDARGNVTRMVDPRGHDTLYTYNALDQLVRYQTPTNLTARTTTDFTYDANDNLVRVETERRDENDLVIVSLPTRGTLRRYDALNRCTEIVRQVSANHFITNRFSYDANDNVVAVHSPLAVSGIDPHAITHVAYDERDLPFQTIAAPGSTVQSTTQWDYDANGNVTRLSEGLEGTPRITTLEYDGFVGFGVSFDAGARYAAAGATCAWSSSLKNRIEPVVWDIRENFAELLILKGIQQITAHGTFADGSSSFQIAGGVKPGLNYWQPGCGSDFDQIAKPSYKNSECDEIKSQLNNQALHVSKITDPNGNITTFNYDANNNLKVARRFGQLNDTPGTNGNIRLAESRWKYDGLDRRTESRTAFFNPATQAPIGDGASVTTFAYAPNGQCTTVMDDLGRVTTFAYDTACRLSSVSSDGGKSVFWVFPDTVGNVTRTTQTDVSDLGGSPQVFSRTNVYDSLNRLVSTTDNTGNNENWQFDSLGRVVRATDAKGNVSWASYDDLSRQTLAIADLDSDGLQDVVVDVNTSWAYDANSRLVSVTDDNTNTTSYAYDSLGRQILATSPDGTAHVFVWNASSDLVREQDANGTVITNSYDLLGRCVRRDIIPGAGVAATTTFESFAYDGASRLVAATNDVSHSEFDYDSMGNSTGNRQDGHNFGMSHDGERNLLAMTYPSGRIVTYAYDALNQVTNVSSSASAMTAPTSLAQFAYEGPGRVGRIRRANGTQTDITWNGMVSPPNAPGDFGRWQRSGIGHTVIGGGAVIDQRLTAYDRNQNKTLRAQTAPFYVGGPMTTNLLAYDALDRMTDFARSSGSTDDYVQTYVLDGNGNRQTVFSNGVPQSYVMDATIPPADFQMDQYTMTPFGFESHDENGNRIAKNSTVAQLQYQYDFANRLVAVNDLTTGFFEPVASYSYNALGQRISKTTYPPSPLAPVTKTFALDYWVDADPRWPGVYAAGSNKILEEHVGGVLSEVFVHVSGLKEEIRENDNRSAPPLVRFNPTGVATYLHADDLGNVLALTDDFGNVIGRNDYDDFGLPIFLTSDGFPIATNASPTGNRFLFRGMEWDSETGLYLGSPCRKLYPCRWDGENYDPQTGRAIRGKVKDIRDSGMGRATGNNPWSGDVPAQGQFRKLLDRGEAGDNVGMAASHTCPHCRRGKTGHVTLLK